MFALSPAEAVVLMAWILGIVCAVASVRVAGLRPGSLVVLALAVAVPVLGSVVAMAATARVLAARRSATAPDPR